MYRVEDIITEEEIAQTILACARGKGYLAADFRDRRKSEDGFPGIILAGYGEIWAIECKKQGGRLRPDATSRRTGRRLPGQAKWLKALWAGGAWIRVARPSNLQELLDHLTRVAQEARG